MRASVIVIDWHRPELTRRALAALEAQRGRVDLELVLVVNEARPGAAEAFAAEFPAVVVVAEARNTGFAGGVAAGAARAGGDVLVLVNNDAVPDPDFVERGLARLAAEPDLAAVAGHVVLEGAFRRVDDDRSTDDLVALGGAAWRRSDEGVELVNSTGVVVDASANGVDRDWLAPAGAASAGDDPFAFSGAAVFLRRPALESVGGFDPSLFMYYEDVDVSWRLRLAGHRVGYEPGARVVHRHAGSSSSSGQLVRYRSMRNRLVVTARNGSGRLLARVVLRTVLRLLRDLVGVPYLDGRHRRLLVLEAVPAVVRARRAGRSARRAAVVRPRDLERIWFGGHPD